MFNKTLPILALALLASATLQLHAQNANPNPKTNPASSTTDKAEDKPEPNRFWQASVGGGHYMVALERISSVSRHKYLLDGSVIVDEVTVDALGQSLARFYFLRPVSDAVTGNAAGNAASRIVDRGREIIDKAADDAGTDIHNMVVKKFPETTHAHTIEFRVHSEQELTGLYGSVRAAWETGRGRSFRIK
jgi:hypothetical protein